MSRKGRREAMCEVGWDKGGHGHKPSIIRKGNVGVIGRQIPATGGTVMQVINANVMSVLQKQGANV
jgi:hypothetical protein